MTLVDAIAETVRALSPEDQERVLAFARSMKPLVPVEQRKDPRGMFEHLGVHLTLEELQEARREAWASSPRPPSDEAAP